MRALPIAVAGLLLLTPALAQETGSASGRYQITPNDEGFTRLDTETGSLSHCAKHDGVWKCAPLAGSESGLAQKVDRLAGEVARLSAAVDALSARLDGLATRLDAMPARPEKSATAPESQSDEQLNFAERVMQRVFDMVRALKHEAPDPI